MRGNRFSTAGRGMLLALAVVAGFLFTPAINWTAPAIAADVTAATGATTGAMSQSLRRLLDGNLESTTPLAVNDLRAMQGHVRSLSQQLKKCTVGVRVDNDRGSAWGSGVIISKDGFVLTAAHVAGKPNQDCEFTLEDGTNVKGRTLGMVRTFDAGLMKITKAGEYTFAELGNGGKLREGQWCIAMGHPGGPQEDRGAVLRLGRILVITDNDRDKSITTDCTLVGGDSGGPLFDLDGRVIGINSRIGEQYNNNMHVLVNAFHDGDAWDRMVKGDAWGLLPGQQSGWLGVTGDRTAENAKILTVAPKSPAEHYGLLPGDVVQTFDGRPIKDFKGLIQAVAGCHVDESVVLGVMREDKLIEKRIRLWKRSE